jgi:hypothetical protein
MLNLMLERDTSTLLQSIQSRELWQNSKVELSQSDLVSRAGAWLPEMDLKDLTIEYRKDCWVKDCWLGWFV